MSEKRAQNQCNFNPLPPHGGRHKHGSQHRGIFTFQSTPSAWRETDIAYHPYRMYAFQSTPSAWRETIRPWCYQRHGQPFQSTPSAWRETLIQLATQLKEEISIHSLRMEGDQFVLLFRDIRNVHFNPLPPHGGRLPCIHFPVGRYPFQSTPSAWRETCHSILPVHSRDISIHSLRMEGDSHR